MKEKDFTRDDMVSLTGLTFGSSRPKGSSIYDIHKIFGILDPPSPFVCISRNLSALFICKISQFPNPPPFPQCGRHKWMPPYGHYRQKAKAKPDLRYIMRRQNGRHARSTDLKNREDKSCKASNLIDLFTPARPCKLQLNQWKKL